MVDLDGVLADVRHRLQHLERRPKDWDAFFAAAPQDPVHEEGLALVRRLLDDHDVVFLTGRPERCRRDTEEWLGALGLGDHQLVMRPANQREPAARLKVRLLRRLAGERPVAVVVDDDPAVIESMAAAGYPTFHADWERLAPEDEAALRDAQEVEGRS